MQLIQPQRLGSVHQGLGRVGMKIHQDHVGAGDHALCGGMKDIHDAIRPGVTGTYGVRRINAHRHARQHFHRRDMGEVHHVPVRITILGFHAAQAKYHLAVALTGQVFRRVQ